jgi:hypothetical protein
MSEAPLSSTGGIGGGGGVASFGGMTSGSAGVGSGSSSFFCDWHCLSNFILAKLLALVVFKQFYIEKLLGPLWKIFLINIDR